MKEYKEKLIEIQNTLLLTYKEQDYITENYLKQKAALESLGFDYHKMDSQLPSDMTVELCQDCIVIKVPHWIINFTSSLIDKSSSEYKLYCKTHKVYKMLESHRLFRDIVIPPEPEFYVRYRIYSFDLPEELMECIEILDKIKEEGEILSALIDNFEL